MRKELPASITVEAALIVPVILFVFGVLLNLLFYYHDKNVVTAVSHDTASYGSYLEEPNEANLKQYLATQLQGKLLLFQTVQSDIQVKENQIIVCCKTQKNGMLIEAECSVNRTEPQAYIRKLRKIQKIGEEIKQ